MRHRVLLALLTASFALALVLAAFFCQRGLRPADSGIAPAEPLRAAHALSTANGSAFGEADSSIVLGESFRTVHGTTIENGSAFDRARVDLKGYRKVAVPDDATVRRGERGQLLQILMDKCLDYMGHPTIPMSIRTMRKQMGCATREEGEALVVATFGEWDSHIEGGAAMRIIVIVPEGVEVEKREGLSGPTSAGADWQGQERESPKLRGMKGCWYRPASPADGWVAVPDAPDPDRKPARGGEPGAAADRGRDSGLRK
jgi:hypothetical protein